MLKQNAARNSAHEKHDDDCDAQTDGVQQFAFVNFILIEKELRKLDAHIGEKSG